MNLPIGQKDCLLVPEENVEDAISNVVEGNLDQTKGERMALLLEVIQSDKKALAEEEKQARKNIRRMLLKK